MKRRNFIATTAAATAAHLVTGFTRPSPASARPDETNPAGKIDSAPIKEICTLSQTPRSGIAHGGIGAGFIELRKNGKFYNWNIFNNYPKQTGPHFEYRSGDQEAPGDSNLFFIVRFQEEGKEPRLKLLQISEHLGEAAMTGIIYYYPWLSPVEKIESITRFPFTKLIYSDPEMPVVVELEAFSPFIPHDIKNSSLPLIYFNFKITSLCEKPVDVMILATLRNSVGYDNPERHFVTEFLPKSACQICQMTCGDLAAAAASSTGSMTLASLSSDGTYYLGWEHRHPYYEILLREKVLPNIDDTEGRNHIDQKTGKKRVNLTNQGDARLFSTLAQSKQLTKNQSFEHSFLMTWHFPNLYGEDAKGSKNRPEGHYYANFFSNAAEVADYAVQNKTDLHQQTHAFIKNFYDSSAPQYVLDQINSQLNTFITSGRLVKNGDFGIQEGMAASQSWGPVATIDVMLYGSIPVITLFPELQKATMRAHKRQQSAKGEIAHGLHKNFESLEDGTAGVYHRLDLPGQYIQMVLRDFFWTNDLEYLKEMWPSVKKAIDYILAERDFNGDSLPTMKGIECSYDNFPMYGMASYIISQWLAAMASAAVAARVVGDGAAEQKYKAIWKKGSQLMDEKRWNGQYYRLYNDEGGIQGGLDEGCLTDQLIGQWVAHLSGLGYLLQPERVKEALKNILTLSFKSDFGLRNCSWPGDKYWHDIPKDIWVDQANTCWTGVELAFASFLIYEGLYQEGMNVIKTVDDRYRKAGLYWDHQEFGGHYFRPMAAWAIVNALAGLTIHQQNYRFNPQIPQPDLRLFFALPECTAHLIRAVTNNSEKIQIDVHTGKFTFQAIEFKTFNKQNKNVKIFLDQKPVPVSGAQYKLGPDYLMIFFKGKFIVEKNQQLEIVLT